MTFKKLNLRIVTLIFFVIIINVCKKDEIDSLSGGKTSLTKEFKHNNITLALGELLAPFGGRVSRTSNYGSAPIILLKKSLSAGCG